MTNKPKYYICPIPSKYMKKLKNPLYSLFALVGILMLTSCGSGNKGKGGSSLPNDGQVHGISPGNRYSLPKPPGMVYIPQGTFHMGPSDEDPAYAFSARNRSVGARLQQVTKPAQLLIPARLAASSGP